MSKEYVFIVALYFSLILSIFIRFYSKIFEKINVFVVNNVLGVVSFFPRYKLLLTTYQ